MFFRLIFLLAFCYCWPLITMAQQVETVRVKTKPGPYLRFDQFTVNNEAFKQAYSKSPQLQDSQGYLWFLSEPNPKEQLIRYDGTYYKSFGSGGWFFQDSRGTDIVREDETHQIWAASKNGLALFDPIREKFQVFRNPYSPNQQLHNWVTSKDGRHWFLINDTIMNGPIQALIEFNGRTRQFHLHKPTALINGYAKQQEPQQSQSISLFPKAVDQQGRIWGQVNTQTSLHLGCYDPVTTQLVWYPVNGFVAPEFDKSAVYGHQLDALTCVLPEERYVWISSWGRMGLLRLDTQTGHWKQFYFPLPNQNRVFQIIPRNTHQFWLQSIDMLLLFDKTSETLFTYAHQPDNTFTPRSEMSPYALTNDQSLWLGLTNSGNKATLGVLHETKQIFRFKEAIKGEQAWLIYKANQKLYYSYVANEHHIVEEQDEVRHTSRIIYKQPVQGNYEQSFYPALRDTINHTIWLIAHKTNGGIYQFDEQTRKITLVQATIHGLPPDQNQLSAYNYFRALAQDRQGNVWFASYVDHRSHLLKFNSRTKQFVGFQIRTHGLPDAQFRAIMADHKGIIWLGARGGGTVLTFDPTTNWATEVLPDTKRDNNDVTKILDDPARGVVWIARSDDGLWQFNRKGNKFRRVISEPIIGAGLYLTKEGILWFKTGTSLVRFNPETGQQIRLGVDYDLHDFYLSPFIKTDDDEFFFEKFRFYDTDIKPDTTKPNVVFSFVKVFDRELPLPQSLNHTSTITLNYDQNFFTIGFSALSYFQSERNQYAYQLVNFNKDWVDVGNKPLAVFSNVPPGTYQFQIKGSNNDGIWSNVKTISIHITPPFWQTWWFRMLVVFLALAAIVTLYRFQLERNTLRTRLEAEEAKRKQKEAELSEKEAAFKLKISETEMSALRAQMNPHFIFNCLNSIQYFTAQNDNQKASDYLTKFARLIRLVLENSKSERVTLANELETLRLYLEMEAMRFQQKVHYLIDVDQTIDADSIQIPPLLLQPFVENAIWHGLMHKDYGGTVQIQASLPQDNLLEVTITDNGIGRQKAAEYKSKSATKQKSFGMKITADRIELINQLYQIQTNVVINDLANEKGQPTGTKVTLRIPI